MKSNNTSNNIKLFAMFADKNFSVWKQIIGCEVKHNTYGWGKIEEVTESNNCIYIKIKFLDLPESKRLKTFRDISFTEGYFENIDFKQFPVAGFNEFCDMKVKKRLIREENAANKIEEQSRKEAKFLEEFNF